MTYQGWMARKTGPLWL